MYCTECGEEIPEGSRFCKHCGADLGVDTSIGSDGSQTTRADEGGSSGSSGSSALKVLGIILVFIVGIILFAAVLGTLVLNTAPDGSSSSVGSSTYDIQEVKNNSETIPYSELRRNIEQYEGEYVHYRGEIVQQQERGDDFIFRISVEQFRGMTWDPEKDILVRWEGERFIKDDVVEFWGVVEGQYTYETVLGSQRTIPEVTSLDMRLVGG